MKPFCWNGYGYFRLSKVTAELRVTGYVSSFDDSALLLAAANRADDDGYFVDDGPL